MSQSFHIVDGGRAPPQTFLCREGRFNTGIAALAFNGLEHRGLFTADIGTSSCNYIEVAAEVGSQYIFSYEPISINIVNGFLALVNEIIVLIRDIDIDGCRFKSISYYQAK